MQFELFGKHTGANKFKTEGVKSCDNYTLIIDTKKLN